MYTCVFLADGTSSGWTVFIGIDEPPTETSFDFSVTLPLSDVTRLDMVTRKLQAASKLRQCDVNVGTRNDPIREKVFQAQW